MNLYNNSLYIEDIQYVADLGLPWEKIENKNIVVTGATGLIGSFFIDVLMEKVHKGLNCTVYALGRSKEKFVERFSKYCSDVHLRYVYYDSKELITKDKFIDEIHYILHLASNTHPLQYATDPIGTITTNVIGLYNLLEIAAQKKTIRFVFASSNEIYGENRGDVELFDEKYCGYIDSNTLRAGYPESKRCGEALCQAYIAQKGLDIVIPRFTRTYGPTMLMTDTKAVSQFIKKGLSNEDIVLKSKGTQYYSYQYVADSVSGLLTVLLMGETGRAYNIADEKSDIMLKDLAGVIADIRGRKVIFEIPDAIEASGYSKATKARLDGSKLKELGWKPYYDIKTGIMRTINILSGNIRDYDFE